MNNRRYVVRRRKPGQDWQLAHNGMIYTDPTATRLVRNYQAHGYEAERYDCTAETHADATFYDSI